MSNIEFKEPATNEITPEIPHYSAADIRENQASEVINMEDVTPTIEAHLQLGEPISEEAIKAIAVRDELVRGRYVESVTTIENAGKFTQKTHTDVVEAAEKFIVDIHAEFNSWLAEHESAKNIAIATIEEQFQRNIEHMNGDMSFRISNSEKTIEDARDLLNYSKASAAHLLLLVEHGARKQTQHERRRDDSVRIINNLLAEYELKQSELEAAQIDLAKYEDKLLESEQRRGGLLDEESDLRTEERIERDNISLKDISELINSQSMENGMSDALKEGIKAIKRDATSSNLSRIMNDLFDIKEKLARNTRNIDNNASLVDATNLIITKLENRINEIPELVEIEQRKLASELQITSPEIEQYSKESIVVTETFYAMNRGDTAAVARSAVPPMLKSVWEAMRTFQQSLRKTNADQEKDWPEPDYDATMLLPLRDTEDESEYNISDVSKITENREKFNENIAHIRDVTVIGKIGKGFLKAGANVLYLKKASEPLKD